MGYGIWDIGYGISARGEELLKHLVGFEAAVLAKEMGISHCLFAALSRYQGQEASHLLLATLGHMVENEVVHCSSFALLTVVRFAGDHFVVVRSLCSL